MKRTLLSLAILALLTGCAAAGGALNTAGNWLESRDNGVAKSVGGFYKDLGSSLAGKPTKEEEGKKKE